MEICLILLVCILGFVFLAWQTAGGKVLTGPATVVSRRVEAAKAAGSGWGNNSGWNYLVTFRLAGGEEIELYVFKEQYQELTEGLSGQLTWHKETLSGFATDMEVMV